jgi:hypothetical protein
LIIFGTGANALDHALSPLGLSLLVHRTEARELCLSGCHFEILWGLEEALCGWWG